SRQLAVKVQSSMVSTTGAVSRGVKQASFAVIRQARIPAVLVEIGFANHLVEGRKLNTDAYRQLVARGIADGILKFLGVNG
ncbi:MAG TPA: N-acetylmuramoyl-L-alanine amidase, partial [Deinococcales bacterium]|nr:N-acetylmuramoyl-L-alanine amidase [Deinococcales bacterium]